MSRSLSRGQAQLLGSVVLGALVLGGGGLFLIRDHAGWNGGSFHVAAGFPDVNGVEVGSPVRLQGINVGEVEAIVPPAQPGGPVRLELRLAARYRPLVRTDTRVQVVSESLIAGKVVRLLPGSADSAIVDDAAELAAEVQPDLFEGIGQAATRLTKLLVEVDTALAGFRKKEGSLPEELARATARLNAVLTKAETALARVERGEGTLGKLVRDEKLYDELTASLGHIKGALDDIEKGNGTLGKLVKSNEVHAEALASLQDVRRMVTSVKQNADAIKTLPVVRSYVVDLQRELVRPDCRRLRRVLPAKDVFEPRQAVLTDDGRKLLDEAAGWLNEHKEAGSEVVVAAFTEEGAGTDFPRTLTQKQADVVVDYLRSQHRVHRTGWWYWSTRTVRAVGAGDQPPPMPESERLPAARVELIVFVPAS